MYNMKIQNARGSFCTISVQKITKLKELVKQLLTK
uniref:Ras-associating domain-containing protein n=1 Tax=Salmonella phage PMBT27 TaxID=3137285 RepID=A0AAU8BWL7_9VIRU